MKKPMHIEMVTGQQFEAEWARTFNPADKDIVIRLADRPEKKLVPLSRVCCILMQEPPLIDLESSEKDSYLIVETVTGKSYSVRSIQGHQGRNGFFAAPTDKDSPYKIIYFTRDGVSSRRNDVPVGLILENQGVLSPEDLKKALDEQQRLKNQNLGAIISREQHLEQDTIDEIVAQAQQNVKSGKWLRVGDILVEAGLITRKQVEMALASQEEGKKKKIGRLLVELGLVTEGQVLAALAAKFHLPFIDLSQVEPDQRALAAFSPDLIMQLRVFPVADRGEYLEVATSRPTDLNISNTLRFHTNRRIELVTATSEQIGNCIAKYYEAYDDQLQQLVDNLTEDDDNQENGEETTTVDSDSETIRLANKILIDAYLQGASDIHLEPGPPKSPLGIRYRIDGICKTIQMLPSHFAKPLLSRIKILASMDIAEHRKAQSGKIMLRFQGKKVEYRLEVTPTVGGNEDAVLRILAASKPMGLEEMGLSPDNLLQMKELVVKPYGIILCVGPTGSGKTTTLHAALGYINKPERKIWTVEDPVEITQAGLRQIEVKPKQGFTFHEALRSLLRADPDVVMIGEMRDREAAHTAVEASLTGHLVFSTLHTNSAAETVTRLIEMGEDPFNLADALLGVLAQRLARSLCPLCKEAYQPTTEEYELLRKFYGVDDFAAHGYGDQHESLRLMRSHGCPECGGSGYKGRIAVHELLVCTDLVRQTIKSGSSVQMIQQAAVDEGMRTLRMDGIAKVLAGMTDLEQVKRVCL